MHGILEEVAALVRDAAAGRRQVQLAPEVAAWIERATLPAPTSAPMEAGQMDTAQCEAVAAPVARAAQSPSGSPQPRTAAPAAPSLDSLAQLVAQCTACNLSSTRTQTVFGSGNARAELVFVGEAPGEAEDRQGFPFVGPAGQLLTDIIEKGMRLSRSDVYICNVLKCRPPGNRDPLPDEMLLCEPFLVRQLELIQPRVICALGGYAAKQLLKTDTSVGRLRGQWHSYHGIPLRVTYHPSYVLRQLGHRLNEEKRKVWEDVQAIMRLLDGTDSPR